MKICVLRISRMMYIAAVSHSKNAVNEPVIPDTVQMREVRAISMTAIMKKLYAEFAAQSKSSLEIFDERKTSLQTIRNTQ